MQALRSISHVTERNMTDAEGNREVRSDTFYYVLFLN